MPRIVPRFALHRRDCKGALQPPRQYERSLRAVIASACKARGNLPPRAQPRRASPTTPCGALVARVPLQCLKRDFPAMLASLRCPPGPERFCASRPRKCRPPGAGGAGSRRVCCSSNVWPPAPGRWGRFRLGREAQGRAGSDEPSGSSVACGCLSSPQGERVPQDTWPA